MSLSPPKASDALPALDQMQPPVRGLILDMDGVLWRDEELIGDPGATLSSVRAQGIQFTFATNNATTTADHYVARLQRLGVEVSPQQIVTSAEATAGLLSKELPAGSSLFVVGEQGLVKALRDRGFQVDTDPAAEGSHAAVVAGMDRGLTFAKIEKAARLILNGAAYYGTNPDPTFPTGAGLSPGAGACLAAITTAALRQPVIVGKPSPVLLEMAADRMGLSPADVLVVGDRLETDIAGGQAFGARTALVLSGVSSEEDARAWDPPPTLIRSSLGALVGP